MEVLLLPVDKEFYSLPVQSFREVVSRPRITRLPASPESVLGLINVRGEIIPLFDVAALLGTGQSSAASFAAVFETASGRAAVGTTAPPFTESLGKRAGVSEVAGTRGVYRQADERLSVLLDLDGLLARLRQ